VDNEGRLISLDSETGQERWRIDTGEQYGQAAVTGNNVFYIDREGVAVAVDMESGREKWRSAIAGAASLRSSVLTAAEGETVYIQSSDSHARMKMLTAMSTMDGAVRWTHPLDDVSASICAGPGMVFLLTSTPAIRDGHPFTTYNLVAFDDLEGSTMWESKIVSDSQPLLKFIDGVLYYGTFSENGAALHGLDPASGIERWSARPEGRSSVPTAFAVRNGLVYMNDMSEMYAADIQTGKIWWNVKAGGPLMVTPVIAGDSICFAFGAAGTLYALPLPAD
jgi:outer membrane protein assembly factor BamB